MGSKECDCFLPPGLKCGKEHCEQMRDITQLILKGHRSHSITLNLHRFTLFTVGGLKEVVGTKANVGADAVTLHWAGKEMNDDGAYIAKLDMVNGSIVVMTAR